MGSRASKKTSFPNIFQQWPFWGNLSSCEFYRFTLCQIFFQTWWCYSWISLDMTASDKLAALEPFRVVQKIGTLEIWAEPVERSSYYLSTSVIFFFFFIFFKIEIHSMQGWTATKRHGVTRKRSTKRLKHTGNPFRKNLQLKDIC